jgi:outer membrane lipoprotein-sorting protein
MIFGVFFSLTLFSSLVAADTNNSVELLNNALTQNYSFVERSLSKSDLKIEESAGEILFNNPGFIVNITSPFKERYEVNKDIITIHDIDLEQSRKIKLEDVQSIFLNILLNGLKTESDIYLIKENDYPNFMVVPLDDSSAINFIFDQNNLSLIRYTDSLGIEHGIELTKL